MPIASLDTFRARGSARFRAGLVLARGAGWLSRAAGTGTGTALAGRVLQAVSPDCLSEAATGLECVLVSATNGKTTTTAMVAAALGTGYQVVSNSLGNNMTAGIAEALSHRGGATHAAIEVDEAHLPLVMESTRPVAVVLMNLSRDQLDRVSEVRKVADRWREAIAAHPECTVVANVADPMVAYAVENADRLVAVELPPGWRLDATVCPRCDTPLAFTETTFACPNCGFASPGAPWHLRAGVLAGPGGLAVTLSTALPGAFNLANAAMAVVLAAALGLDPQSAADAISAIAEVKGRFARTRVGEREVTLLMAKNPAGWQATVAMLAGDGRPVVLSINAEIADGKDTSWLYDVDFTPLASRQVIACGRRRHDLSTRLGYDGVAHLCMDDEMEAIAACHGAEVVFVGNYTAFQGMRKRIARGHG